jgi:hypothetical protein
MCGGGPVACLRGAEVQEGDDRQVARKEGVATCGHQSLSLRIDWAVTSPVVR